MINLAKTKWHFFHIRNRGPLMVHFVYYSPANVTLPDFPYHVQTNGSCCYHIILKKDEYNNLQQKIWERQKVDPSFILNVMNGFYKKDKEIIVLLRELLKKNYTKSSNQELFEDYMLFVNCNLQFGPAIYIPLVVESLLSDEVRKSIKNEEEYDIVMSPFKDGEFIEERKDLLKMKIKGKLELSKHLEKYSYLKEKGMTMDFYDEKYYQKRYDEIKDAKKVLYNLEDEKRKRAQDFNHFLNEYDKESQLLFKTTNEAVYFRTWRMDRLIQHSYYIVPLFKEIAKRLEFEDFRDILWFLPDEIKNVILNNKKGNKQVLKERKEAFIYLTLPDGRLLEQGKKAKELFKELTIFDNNSNEVHGTCAHRGIVQGKVTVVNSISDYKKIEGAEILVAHATFPQMVQYFTHVKAMVTEEGGILSHAAIVSREMKIPSVIGTGNATKVLKDGDMVQVDAESGIVRKI